MIKFDFKDGNGLVSAHQHQNGGGWVADTATVAATAYVGVDARVFGKARVSGHAQVAGHAWVRGDAQVTDNQWTWAGEPAPSIENQKELATKILAHAENGLVGMESYHCGTSHCIAGWCQVESGAEINSDTAYEAGVKMLPALAPYFFESNEIALVKLKEFVGK